MIYNLWVPFNWSSCSKDSFLYRNPIKKSKGIILFFCKIYFIISYVCVCGYVYVNSGAMEAGRLRQILWLKLQSAVSHLIHVLWIKLTSSAKEVFAFNCRTINNNCRAIWSPPSPYSWLLLHCIFLIIFHSFFFFNKISLCSLTWPGAQVNSHLNLEDVGR